MSATVTVKVAWIVFVCVVGTLTLCTWRNPRAAVPIGVGIAAAAALTPILRL
jgi:hypothetical protein